MIFSVVFLTCLTPIAACFFPQASNHLDAQTIEALTTALQDFNGAIIAITHNRAFATSLNATHILRVEGGQVRPPSASVMMIQRL